MEYFLPNFKWKSAFKLYGLFSDVENSIDIEPKTTYY